MACENCGISKAIILRPKNKMKVCKECFYELFEEEIHTLIVSTNMFEKGSRVGVGISGGKDSTVLAYVLNKLNIKHNYGLDLILLCVDEGISGYRDKSIDTVHENQSILGLDLKIVSYEEIFGITMDQIVGKIGKKGNCTYCGILRRQSLEDAARKMNCDCIVTGHNADDLAETILLNFFRGDISRLKRCTLSKTKEAIIEEDKKDRKEEKEKIKEENEKKNKKKERKEEKEERKEEIKDKKDRKEEKEKIKKENKKEKEEERAIISNFIKELKSNVTDINRDNESIDNTDLNKKLQVNTADMNKNHKNICDSDLNKKLQFNMTDLNDAIDNVDLSDSNANIIDLNSSIKNANVSEQSKFLSLSRCKPFKYSYQKEIVFYAYFKKLPYFSTECTYAPGASRGDFRTLIKDLEKVDSEIILKLIKSGEHFIDDSPTVLKVRKCISCSHPTSSQDQICNACGMIEKLKSMKTSFCCNKG